MVDVKTRICEDEKKLQVAVGALPMPKYTLIQPVDISITVLVELDVEAIDNQKAVEEFKNIIQTDQLRFTTAVENTISTIVNQYSSRKDCTIVMAALEGRKNMDDNKIIITKCEGDLK